MSESTFSLAPPRQLHVAGLALGVIAIKPDENDRVALIGIYNPDTGEPEQHRLRPGDEVDVAGRVVRVTDIVTEDDAHVDLTVVWPEDSA